MVGLAGEMRMVLREERKGVKRQGGGGGGGFRRREKKHQIVFESKQVLAAILDFLLRRRSWRLITHTHTHTHCQPG